MVRSLTVLPEAIRPAQRTMIAIIVRFSRPDSVLSNCPDCEHHRGLPLSEEMPASRRRYRSSPCLTQQADIVLYRRHRLDHGCNRAPDLALEITECRKGLALGEVGQTPR